MKRLTSYALLTGFVTVLFTASLNAATITGVVKYDGEAPKFKEIKMDADPICMALNKEAVFPQTLVLGEGNAMQNVFVQVTNAPKKDFPVPTDVITIEQKGCVYEPHVIGVGVGQTLRITNPDGTLHNVHSNSKINPEFNLAMPKFRTEVTKVFEKAEALFPMKCDVHPWMLAWVAVMDHPFYSATKNDGKFNIDNLPAGTYTIQAWHEKLGQQEQSVTIADGETKEINFTFAKPSK